MMPAGNGHDFGEGDGPPMGHDASISQVTRCAPTGGRETTLTGSELVVKENCCARSRRRGSPGAAAPTAAGRPVGKIRLTSTRCGRGGRHWDGCLPSRRSPRTASEVPGGVGYRWTKMVSLPAPTLALRDGPPSPSSMREVLPGCQPPLVPDSQSNAVTGAVLRRVVPGEPPQGVVVLRKPQGGVGVPYPVPRNHFANAIVLSGA